MNEHANQCVEVNAVTVDNLEEFAAVFDMLGLAERPSGKANMKLTKVHHPRALRRYVSMVIALCVALMGAIVMTVQHSAPAAAATKGVGIDFDTVGFLGSFELANGERAYCVEIKVWEPWDPQEPVTTVTSLPAFSGDLMIGSMLGMGGVELDMPVMNDAAHMRQINYILSTWGDTQDDAQAAAVALAVFAVRGDPIGYNDALQQQVITDGGGAVVDPALDMVAEAQSRATAGVQGAPPAEPVLRLDSDGYGQVEYAAGTHTLTLEHAVFEDTGATSVEVDPSVGGTREVRSVKPDGWDASYDVEVIAEWKSGFEGWRGELNLYAPTRPGEQRIVTPTGATTGFAMRGVHRATATVQHTWAPIITTQVQDRVLQVGDPFVDDLTVDADPSWGDWSQDASGTYMPLVAHGTLYGPLESDPAASPRREAPADAPVAAEVTVAVDEGPGTYRATAPKRAFESGFYTWVWRFDWDEQPTSVTDPERTGVSSLRKESFPISDDYGLVTETHVVKQRMSLTTRLTSGEVGLGWSLIDDVAVTPEQFGGWLTDSAGERLPVVLRGTVYHSDAEPVQSSTAPDEATPVAQTSLVVTGEGIHESEPIPLPINSEGYVTMQWCILDEDQAVEYRGFTREWCDDYGVPAETARVVAPKITTLAQSEATVGDVMYDDAFVEGLVPNNAELSFTAYLLPEVGNAIFDEEWNDTGETWTQKNIDVLEADERCLAQPVATTEPQVVKEAGTHRSPDIATRSTGTIHWVETLTALDPTTGEREIVHTGECGIPNETTKVVAPPAPELAMTGGTASTTQAIGGSAALLTLAGLCVLALHHRRRIAR